MYYDDIIDYLTSEEKKLVKKSLKFECQGEKINDHEIHELALDSTFKEDA